MSLQPDHAERAWHCAVEMQARIEQLRTPSHDRCQIRIGIATGIVAVGNMGSSRRLSYTVLGHDVNLAQRLQVAASPGGIVMSARTRELVAEQLDGVVPVSVELKGIPGPVAAFALAPVRALQKTEFDTSVGVTDDAAARSTDARI